jgi:CHAT domain-containing protein/tetratricopeptide (TPR) repeat protein
VPRATQRALEAGTIDQLQRTWAAALARNADDRVALLWLATIERNRYHVAKADSFYRRIVDRASPDELTAAAHLGMAAWRGLGPDIRGADSLFALARSEAQALGAARIAFEAGMGLSSVRTRTAGPRVGLQLLRDAWSGVRSATVEDSAQRLCTEAAMLGQLGDSTWATRVQEGTDKALRARAYRVYGNCELLLAQTAERQGYNHAAAGAAHRALNAFARSRHRLGTALASQWFGYLLVQQGALEEARPHLETAVAAARETGFESVEAWAHSGLAELNLSAGDLREARTQAATASLQHANHGDLWGLAVSRRFEGRIAETQLQLPEAAAKYDASVSAFRRAGLTLNAMEVMRHLALVQMRMGNLDSAERVLDNGDAIARTGPSQGWQTEAAMHRARLDLLRGNPARADSMLRLSSRVGNWRGRDSVFANYTVYAIYEAEIALKNGRLAVAESAVTYLTTAIAAWRKRTVDQRLRTASASQILSWEPVSLAYPVLVEGLSSENRLPLAFRLLETVRAREVTERSLRAIAGMRDSAATLRTWQAMEPTTISASIDDLRRVLRPDEAFITLTLGFERGASSAIIVTSDSASSVSLPSGDVLRPLIARYVRLAASGVEPVQLSRQLGTSLMAPLLAKLPGRVTHLLVSPDGDLFQVPLDALRLPDNHFVVERYAVSLTPSATYAVIQRSRSQPSTGSSLVAFANPMTRAARARPGNESSAAPFDHVAFAPLPNSADEARRVARYGRSSVVLTASDATESRAKQRDWRGVGVVHFATHAVVDREGPSRTALVLTPSASDDGFLTPTEISGMRFPGALIVLSACETLGGQVLGGEGLRGITAPLLEAGARAVVATQWSIGDRSVAPFVDRLYAAMANGESVGDALRSAKLSAIRDDARISDWAGFAVFGDATLRPPLRQPGLTRLQWLRDLVQPMRDTSSSRF